MQSVKKFIHLLYAPTNFCNMGCQYCYLGTGTDEVSDADNAVATLEYALQQFLQQGFLPFNVSLHGGEATAIPRSVLQQLLQKVQVYYQQYGDQIKQAGYPLNPLHIKTNLYNFDKLYDLFDHYQVSISGSVDLPLRLHEKYRTDKRGRSTLQRITANLKLLAQYPHNKKISCVVTQEHFAHLDQLIADIRYIHYDIGLDMRKFNVMFAFDSVKNEQKFQQKMSGTEMLTQAQQVEFYQRLSEAFKGTELEAGLKQHWFKEFTPEFCCSAVNCGDKFFLLQNDGAVYACPRGQSSQAFYYGNVYQDSITQIVNNGWQTIEALENRLPADEDCFRCQYLPYCNQGCVFVREQTGLTKSYTCLLQQAIYQDNPAQYPPYSAEQIRHYAAEYQFQNHLQTIAVQQLEPKKRRYITPELHQDENALATLIAQDQVLQQLYEDDRFILCVDGVDYPMQSPILNNQHHIALLSPQCQIQLKVRCQPESIFALNCADPVNNYLHLMLLRNTLVRYGDEGREKQEHLLDYSLYQNTFDQLAPVVGDYQCFDMQPFFQQHHRLFLPEVRNNLYITSKTLREYHYSKQKKNAFYHIQAINLPFAFLEFYWVNG